MYILAGASIGTIQNNILNPLTQKYGIQFNLNKHNQFRLFDVITCCVGHDDIGRLKPITGMTAYGAYLNEASLAHKDVFDEITKRCSADVGFNAKIIADTNPDSPVHWLKTDYIDRANQKKIAQFHWELYDNPFLSQYYVKNLEEATPSGVFYYRKINGLWVTAEGIVYQDFDKDKHFINSLDGYNIISYFAGVDWGYEHKGSICLFGITDDDIIIMLKEITEKHKLIDWWTNEALKLIKEYGYGIPFYCDSARPDNLQSFKKANLWTLNAKKDISPGVECVAGKIKTNKLLIYKPGIKDFEKQIYTYIWDEKTGLPVKKDDDVMDALRYGIYTREAKLQNNNTNRTANVNNDNFYYNPKIGT